MPRMRLTLVLLPLRWKHLQLQQGLQPQKYDILATMNGYDLQSSPESQNELYDVWEMNLDFFEAVIDYYKDSKDVRCYVHGGVFDSDEE